MYRGESTKIKLPTTNKDGIPINLASIMLESEAGISGNYILFQFVDCSRYMYAKSQM